jgi:ADP-heptose:LPS heptosyltransferase
MRLGNVGARRIGLVTTGNPGHTNNEARSIPTFELSTLVDAPDVSFYFLGKDKWRGHDEFLRAHPQVIDLGAELRSFVDTAALVMNLDLVISVDTAVAHLAGALGRPVWIMLPFSSEWRWLQDRSDCPWYPNARLFRQPRIGDWATVVASIRQELARTAALQAPP